MTFIPDVPPTFYDVDDYTWGLEEMWEEVGVTYFKTMLTFS
jgi:hypothetical protein